MWSEPGIRQLTFPALLPRALAHNPVPHDRSPQLALEFLYIPEHVHMGDTYVLEDSASPFLYHQVLSLLRSELSL